MKNSEYIKTNLPKSFKLWINGRWTKSTNNNTITRLSPAHGYPVTTIPEGSEDDVNRAIELAKVAFKSGIWSEISSAERSAVLNTVADKIIEKKEELALLETLESGKPLTQARMEVEWAANLWRHAGALCHHLYGESCNTLGKNTIAMSLREPIGVVGIITPWNFPLLIVSQKVPYALAAGCTVVIKPSELTSATTLMLAEILGECGLPAGVFNVVTGYGAPVGTTLCKHKDIQMISFTGSTKIGKLIASKASETVKKTILELGGKNPMIVMNDANLDAVIDASRLGAFFNMGECCNASSRILVQNDIASEFIKRLSEYTKEFKVGDPLDETVKIGAIINDDQKNKIMKFINLAHSSTAKICLGGKEIKTKEGRFIEPTIIDNVPTNSPLATDEVFGPVLSIIHFETLDEALKIANNTDYGLSSGIFTQDYNQAMKAARKLRAGTVWVNTWLEGHPEISFGGYNQSGLGRELGSKAVEDYTEEKSILFSIGERKTWW